jgi:type IV secretion system protein VirB11
MLRTAMGPAIAAALSDPRVIEIMVNPDGALRVDILGRCASTSSAKAGSIPT